MERGVDVRADDVAPGVEGHVLDGRRRHVDARVVEEQVAAGELREEPLDLPRASVTTVRRFPGLSNVVAGRRVEPNCTAVVPPRFSMAMGRPR